MRRKEERSKTCIYMYLYPKSWQLLVECSTGDRSVLQHNLYSALGIVLYILSISLDTVYYNNHFFSFMAGLEAPPAKRPRINKSKATAMECDESDVLKRDEPYMKPVDEKKIFRKLRLKVPKNKENS